MSANFTKSLKTSIDKLVRKKVKQKAEELRDKIVAESNEWKLDVVGWLSRTRRGHKPGGQGGNAPFMVSGRLRRTIHKSTTDIRKHGKTQWGFKVKTWWTATNHYGKGRKGSFDYADHLNDTPGEYYSNFKDRAIDELHKRMDQIINGRGVTNELHRTK